MKVAYLANGGGLLHRPEDSADLADKLVSLLRDYARRQEFARQRRAAVFDHFSAERMASAKRSQSPISLSSPRSKKSYRTLSMGSNG